MDCGSSGTALTHGAPHPAGLLVGHVAEEAGDVREHPQAVPVHQQPEEVGKHRRLGLEQLDQTIHHAMALCAGVRRVPDDVGQIRIRGYQARERAGCRGWNCGSAERARLEQGAGVATGDGDVHHGGRGL